MPTYEYQCTCCSHELEEFQSITADPLTRCPACGKETLQRKVGGGGAILRFKGEGYYETDYKKGCPCDKDNPCE